ncbi:MAG: hypothetical protein HQ483_06885 [Rhodospirillales bacterium]|nr:hypothetical protein [Rhodospirillales bacterium]
MLKKMIIHGLVAAALIGAAAAVYAQSREGGYLLPNTASTPSTEIGSRLLQSNGYLTDNDRRREGLKSIFRDRDHEGEEGTEHRRKHGSGHDDD